MSGMTCTVCHRPAGSVPDYAIALSPEVIRALCESWRCDDCLDDADHAALTGETGGAL